MVRRPAIYELQSEATLADAMNLAGGILPAAALQHIELQRLQAHDKRTMETIEISPGDDPAAIEKAVERGEDRRTATRFTSFRSRPTTRARFICKDMYSGRDAIPITTE